MDEIYSADSANESESMAPAFKPTPAPTTALIALHRIEPDPYQPRKHFDPQGLRELADSILAMGLIQAPAVRPHPDPDKRAQGMFMLICGERRWRAHGLAGLDSIRVEIHDQLSELDVRRQQFAENFARKDLNLVEEAEALQASIERLAEQGTQAPQRMLAAALGLTESTVSRKLRVLKYSPEVRALVRDGVVTQVNALAALDKLRPADRQWFVTYARESHDAGAVPDVAGFLKSPKRFMQQLGTSEAEAGGAPAAAGEVKQAKVVQWQVRWNIGRAEFAKLIHKTGYDLNPEALSNATDEQLRGFFDEFRAWLLDIQDVTQTTAPSA